MKLKKGTVSVIPIKSIVDNVKFLTKLSIVPDSEIFSPSNEDESPFLEVKVKADNGKITLGHRNSDIIDCGLNISLPAGYKITAYPTEKNARRGLIVTYSDTLDNRLRIAVTNVGKEIVTLAHGESFAIISVEPVYFIDWKTSQV